MASRKLKYTRGMVIVHGKSEYQLVRFVCSNLHLCIKICSKDKGKHSIQINGITDYLKKIFKNYKNFSDEWFIEYNKKKKEFVDFKLFIIMDTDDCDEKTKNDYISGKLFEGSPLKPYIVPIYNSDNLEDVMIKAGIMTKRIHDSEKGVYYNKIFPINNDKQDIEQIKDFANKIKNIKSTNMLEFIEYCFELIGEPLWDNDK